jgi:phytoene dehydrogenase-like protein
VTLAAWLGEIGSPVVRDLMAGLARVTTYADDAERMSAGATLEQVRLGLRGVLYLHRGWQTLVDGLRRRAEDSGARVLAQRRATAVERDGGVHGVRLEDGAVVRAAVVIVAGSPGLADELTSSEGSTAISPWARRAVPVRAATLDVALSHLPRPHATFALGTDQPLYASVHSAVARLAPAGGALIHVMRYGTLGVRSPAAVEAQLEELLDALQPGWRAHVAHRRFVPDLTVSNALVEAASSGTAGRPGPRVPGVRGLYVAGDWVGPEGMLADASLASGRGAALAALEDADRATSAA